MASPDISSYVDLQLIDKDPQDIFDVAQQYLSTQLPELTLREGMMETILLEAVALEVAESIFAINRLPDGMTEVLLQFFGLTRDSGQPPIADLTFQIAGPQGATIPAGSTFVLDIGNGIDPLLFTTDAELVIPAGSSTGTISATGETFTDIYNGTPAGTMLTSQDNLIYVNYITLASTVSEGRDPETDDDYLTRGVQSLQRVSTTLTVPKQFVAAALEFPFVNKAYGLDAYNPATDPELDGPVGQDGGFMTVAVYGDNEPVSAENKDTLQTELEADSQANLIVKVIDPQITPIDIDVTIAYDASLNPADVVAAVTQVLQDNINPNAWNWGNTVRRSTLISLITNVDGVDYVESLNLPATDITLTGVANLVTLGSAPTIRT